MATANHTRAAQISLKHAYGPASMLPPTDNKALLDSTLSLYNPTLFLASSALFQHTGTLALIFLIRGFSTKRVFDIHFLTIIFAVSMILVPLVFLLNYELNRVKLLFFLDHVAIEVLISVRVMLPAEIVSRRPGLILFLLYSGLFGLSLPVIMHDFFADSAMVVAWAAFPCDLCLGTSGVLLIKRWMKNRRQGCRMATMQKSRAEALAGLGFMLHGFPTLCIGPIFTLVVYNGLDPDWFAYAWVMVFLSAFFTIAFAVPSAALFFSNTWWCCGSRRSIYPGEVDWQEKPFPEKPRHRIFPPMFQTPGALDWSGDAYQVERIPIGMQRMRSNVEGDLLAKGY